MGAQEEEDLEEEAAAVQSAGNSFIIMFRLSEI